MTLTPTQANVLRSVRDYTSVYGQSPTLQELSDGLGISKCTVFEHLGLLEAKGAIRRVKRKLRSIEIIDASALRPSLNLSVLGTVDGTGTVTIGGGR